MEPEIAQAKRPHPNFRRRQRLLIVNDMEAGTACPYADLAIRPANKIACTMDGRLATYRAGREKLTPE